MADFTVAMGSFTQLLLRITEVSVNTGANTSLVQVDLYLVKTGGSGAFSGFSDNSWATSTAGAAGASGGGGASGSGTFDLRSVSAILLLSNQWTIAHAVNGTGSVSASGSFSAHAGTSLGSGGATSGTVALTSIPRAPSAPSILSASSVTATGFSLNLGAPGNIGGSAVSSYDVDVSLSSTFASGVTTVNTASLIAAFTSLAPNSAYFARARANNAQGASPNSTTFSVSTGAAGAPHVGVLQKFDRSGFYLVLTPPIGVSVGSVTTYVVTRQVTGPNAPMDVTLNIAGASGLGYFDALVLESGQAVTYRTAAVVAAVQTGFSASATITWTTNSVYDPPWFPLLNGGTGFQPYPYLGFDHSAWSGTADASSTNLLSQKPKGWRKFSQGAGTTGAVGTVGLIGDGFVGFLSTSFDDARYVFSNARTAGAEGVRTGTSIKTTEMAQAFPTVRYYGQIAVYSDVTTLLACEVEWYSSSGVLLARTQGGAVAVAAKTPTVLKANGVAPSSTAYASVVAVDVAGGGWASEGYRIVGNAALNASADYGYFDGDSTDTTSFAYEWRGTQHQSTSLRSSSSSGTALQDPEADPVPQPPQAPVVEEATLTDDIVWRRYVTKIDALDVHEWVAGVPRINIFTALAEARSVRIRWWKNPQNLDANTWVGDGQSFDLEQIVSYIPWQNTFVIDGVTETATVVTPSGDTVDANHLLFGQDGGPADWLALLCGDSYILTADVPTSSIDGNLQISIDLTNRLI